ncbi:MAG: transcriptional regulator [Chloroflexi bacterium]|nr:transcriptional regulator [Chloroflexota bacterium]
MEVPRHWRLKKQRYALEGIAAPQGEPVAVNGYMTLTPERTERSVTRTGTVYSYTIVAAPAADFAAFAPYVLAMVELDDGTRLTAQLTDLDGEPEIGQRVEMVTRKLRTDGDAGIIVYGYKFRPLMN